MRRRHARKRESRAIIFPFLSGMFVDTKAIPEFPKTGSKLNAYYQIDHLPTILARCSGSEMAFSPALIPPFLVKVWLKAVRTNVRTLMKSLARPGLISTSKPF